MTPFSGIHTLLHALAASYVRRLNSVVLFRHGCNEEAR